MLYLYLLSIVSANLITNYFGPIASVINAFVLIGLDLTARDHLHERWKTHLKRNMFLLILTGSVITVLLNISAYRIAIASVAAFSSAAIVDTIVYQLLAKRSRLVKVNASNVASAILDSSVFVLLAFGGLYDIIALQVIVKILGGGLWYLILRRVNDNSIAWKPKIFWIWG